MDTRSDANARARRWSLTGAGLVCFLAPALAYWQASPASSPPPAAAVDAYVQKVLAERSVPAASVAVVRDGKVILARGYGLADVEKGTKATEQTIYPLASVTKPFTAMATLMLVEQGKLSLDGRITEILPGLPAAWGGVTVRHLLSHT
jgi:D-alanyl-D-alanine carboxypeptidase